ncbi:hypothetical protein [Salidesulfovibrio onnuriiensis]|uniref:hypothetical protein n=1 Tax=Salidesulfovibrio onnuriiensis TaxID=2583823 RepID=UPI0011CB0E76|nr:hypothetical protein [Salidesulfovibrio onnuriiensis]
MADFLVVTLFKEPGFTAVVSAVAGALATFFGNYLLQARKARDSLRMEQFKLGRSDRVAALGDFMVLIRALTSHLDPRQTLIGINRFKEIMAEHYDGSLEVKLGFVCAETMQRINRLDDLYAEALYGLVSEDDYERFREKMRTELSELVPDLRRSIKEELRAIS